MTTLICPHLSIDMLWAFWLSSIFGESLVKEIHIRNFEEPNDKIVSKCPNCQSDTPKPFWWPYW